ncbi:MAG: glycosyltransferase family 61 protein [Plectolyngbya sp. WJT66-NPBG17]|jgi:hypothetical protein|nr:glycosyltransferase family 61 protein [Plectolyngbya sp. WJT66-NPBG17]MBW4527363.1 glycosyltransferase family 61 protein [Phormidium tanganyikae FI6-MK23]
MLKTASSSQTKQAISIPGGTIELAAAKTFTYPTRLAHAWEPRILEIAHRAEQLQRREIEFCARPDSTRSLNIHVRNPYKRLYKEFATPIQCRDSYIFDTRYEVDGNIAHILGCIAIKALLARSKFPNLALILRENPHRMAIEAYRLLGFPLICTNRHVEGNLVVMSDHNDEPDFEPFYRTEFGQFEFDGYKPKTPERVFLARRGTRSIINEPEIEQVLSSYGFEKLYFEDFSMAEQWSIARNAKVVVGIHGAALKNFVFNAQGVKLIELFHPGYVVDIYRRDNAVSGGRWCGVTGKLPDDIICKLETEGDARRFAMSRLMIDPTSLQMALDELEIDRL